MSPLEVSAYAKINLALYVLGKRPDGFHEIATLMQAIDLHDTLRFEPADSGIRLECSDLNLPNGEENLVIRAVRRLEKEVGRMLPVSIRLVKRIPVAAGLGGGSSDAAATLWAVNRLFALGLGSDDLGRLAAGLGSDVPFFLTRGQALASGRGEELTELAWPTDFHVLVAFPNIAIRAAEAYAQARFSLTNPLGDGTFHRYLAPEEFRGWIGSQQNDLAAGITAGNRVVARGIETMHTLGAFHAAMSGSGSAVFGLFDRPLEAKQLESWPAGHAWSLTISQPIRATDCSLPAYRRVA